MLRSLVVSSLLCVASLPCTGAAAQNVSAQLKGSTLVVKGSEEADELQFVNQVVVLDGDGGDSGTTVVVVPGGGTSVNGSGEPAVFEGVTKLKISLNGGSDQLGFTDFQFGGPLTVRGGDGTDEIGFSNGSLDGPVKLFGDAGDDTFDLQATNFAAAVKIVGSTGVLTVEGTGNGFDGLQIQGGPGLDVVDLDSCSTSLSVKVNLSAGDDQLMLDAFDVGETFTAMLGPGVNFMNFVGPASVGENLLYRGGTGDDSVLVQDTSVGENLDAKLFGGSNSIDVKAVLQNMNIGEQLVISGGGQDDEVTVLDANGAGFPALGVGSGAKFALKGGINDVLVTGFAQINGLSITLGPQDDVVSLDGCQIQAKLSVSLSNGTNSLTLNDAELQGDLKVTAGSGDDTVALTGTTSVAGTQKINLGGGNNTGP